MKLVDVNLLLYAHDRRSPLHVRAREWFEQCMAQPEPVAFAPATIVAFLRLVTDSRVFARPLHIAAAVEIVNDWLTAERAVFAVPTERHWDILRALAVASQATAALLPDAHLAACAIEHGATLCTHDRDFSRFPGLRVEFPLAS